MEISLGLCVVILDTVVVVIFCTVLLLIMSNNLNKRGPYGEVRVNVGGLNYTHFGESWFKAPTADIYQSILGSNPAKSGCHVSSFSVRPIFHGFLFFTFNH